MIERMPVSKEALPAREPNILTQGRRLEALSPTLTGENLAAVFKDSVQRKQLIETIDRKTAAESTALKEKGGIHAQVAIIGTGPHATAFASALRHEYPDVSIVFIEKNTRRGGQFREDYATFRLNSPTVAPGSYGLPFESDDPNTLGEHTALKIPDVETEKFPTNKTLSDVEIIDNFDTGAAALQTDALGVSRNRDSGTYAITACDLETNRNITIDADVVIAAPGMGKPQQEGGPHHTNYFSPYEFMHYIHQKSPEEIAAIVMDGVALVGDGDSAKVVIEQLIEKTEGHPLTGAKIHLYGAEFSNQEEYLDKNIPRYHGIAPYIGEGLDRLSIIPHPERVDSHTETDDGSLEFTLSDGTTAGPFKTSVFATGYKNSVEELFNPLLTDKELEYLYDDAYACPIAKTIAGEKIYIVGTAADIPYTPEEINAIPANMRRRYRNGLRRLIPRTEEVAKQVASTLKLSKPEEIKSDIIEDMPPPEIPPTHETPPNPEAPKGGSEMVGLRARLIAHDQNLLNPTFKLAEGLGVVTFDDRQYSPYERASRNDRKKAYKADQSFDDQYKEWEIGMTDTFTSDAHAEKITQLGSLLHTMGVNINGDEPFTKDHAKTLFDTYFDTDGGVKKFVGDVLKTYAPQADHGYTTIQNQIENITWLANMFGDEGREMVRELIMSEITLQANPEYFNGAMQTVKDTDGNDVARINLLNEKEEKILTFITGNQQEDKEEEGERREPTKKHPLAIEAHKGEIQQALQDNDTLLIIADTGSGKTIGTPQYIREMLKPGQHFVVTQPRQINTSSLAKGIADLQGVKLGEEIGFQHGDAREMSDKTDTLFATEGTLLMKLVADPTLTDKYPTDYVMVDEVHVQSSLTEQLMDRLLNAQKTRREKGLPPLKIICASATVDREKLERYLPGSKTIKVEVERKHKINQEFSTRDIPESEMSTDAANYIEKWIKAGNKGDIGIFKKSKSQIEEQIEEIKKKNLPNIEFYQIYSGASEEEKKEVEKSAKPGVTRIIVGTDAMETGLNIPGLKLVVNTGRQLEKTLDPRSGLEYLRNIEQSQAGVKQRAGRVGRFEDGDVYNQFTQANYDNRPEFPTPELERTDLTELVLNMKRHGTNNTLDLKLLTTLNPDRLQFAEETLQRLGALNPDGSLNETGKRMAELKTEFHLARMIIAAESAGKGVGDACAIAVMSEARQIFPDQNTKKNALAPYKNPQSDFLTLLAFWKDFEANGKTQEWAESKGLSYTALMDADADLSDLQGQARKNSSPASPAELGRFIYEGYKDHFMEFRDAPARKSYVWNRNTASSINLKIGRDSALAGTQPPYIVAAGISMINEGQNAAYLSNCQTVDPAWITS